MKKIALTVFSTVIFPLIAICQPCLPEGITFETQSQIDSFQIIYPNCTEIEGYVRIGAGVGVISNITNLDGLSVLTSIGGELNIYWNFSLTSLTGLENVTTIGGNLYFENNQTLTSLTGLENVTTIGGSLLLDISYISSLAGLQNLSYIGESLGISFSGGLTNLTGLENLTTIVGSLSIDVTDDFTSLAGLENVTTIGGGLNLVANYDLASLTGLENVTTIGGGLYFEHNPILTSLTGLEGLTSLGGSLNIGEIWYGGNSALTSLTGLENLTSIGGDLEISRNDALTTCDVQSICNYLNNPSGNVRITQNAIGCNSPEQVQDSCIANGVSVEEQYLIEYCYISPNPFTNSTTLTYTLDKPENVQFTIYNVQSQIVYLMQEKQDKGEQKVQWNAEGLPAGMYYFRIQAGGKVGGGKMVKMR